MNGSLQLPPVLSSKLAEFRRRVWWVKLAEGVLAGLFGLALSYLFVLVLDRFIDTPAWLRGALLVLGAAVPGLGLPLQWHKWVWRHRKIEDAARLLQWKFPHLGDQLLGIVELARHDSGGTGRSERLVQAAMAQADAAVKDQDFSDAVPHAKHRQWGWAAASTCVLTAAGFLTINEAARNALIRWLMPWKETERFTFARVEELPNAARDVTFTWKDSLGLTALVPLVLNVQTAEDNAPKIVARRETLEQVVLDSEVVVFDVTTSDDFGVRQVGLSWKGMDETKDQSKQTAGTKIVSAGGPEKKEISAKGTFCAAREGVAPQTLEIRAWSEDYLAGRESSKSAAFVLHVLNREDHALWVTQQMGKWLEAARETYEREQQLHQTNKELRAMTAADLDRPENRRKVAQQASAENANADRLSALNNAGKNMVEQATKNPEFDAARLESWATMLKSLQEIASTRMPSVTDLLKQSADAKADAKMAQNAAGQPNPNPGEAGKPGEPSDAKPGDPNANPNANTAKAEGKPGAGKPSDGKSAPQLALGSPPPAKPGEAPPADPNAKPKEPAPSIKITESTMNKPEEGEAKPPGAPKPPGKSKLGLPSNSLAAAPGAKPEEKPEDPPADSSAQQALDKGVAEQRDLLAEFAKVSDKLSEILASLEASTFVKRFKAASREQTQLASGISQKTLDAFGIVRESNGASISAAVEKDPAANEDPAVDLDPFVGEEDAGDGEEVAAKKGEEKKPEKEKEMTYVTAFAPEANSKAKGQSTIVKVLQSDLEAYSQRKPDQYFKNVLAEMKKTRVVKELEDVGGRVAGNFNGNAIHGAEFWADTLDRWAEEMVKAGKCSNCSCKGGDSLPPEIVLKVMQALRDEMKLRDETRELENSKAAIEADEHKEKSWKLAKEQTRIGEHTMGAVKDILALPQGEEKFGKELKLLSAVTEVMDEASDILRSPDTGGPAVAAESEAIELLLQTKRQNPNGGGGGGGDPGGGGRAASASSAALADLGPGSDGKSEVSSRPVGQATGRAGKEFPEEFKTGLDAYFSNLEGTGGRQ